MKTFVGYPVRLRQGRSLRIRKEYWAPKMHQNFGALPGFAECAKRNPTDFRIDNKRFLWKRNRMGFGELQGLYAKKFQEGNSGPNAYTGKKSQRNGKRYKKNTQFQYFLGNIFLYGRIF